MDKNLIGHAAHKAAIEIASQHEIDGNEVQGIADVIETVFLQLSKDGKEEKEKFLDKVIDTVDLT